MLHIESLQQRQLCGCPAIRQLLTVGIDTTWRGLLGSYEAVMVCLDPCQKHYASCSLKSDYGQTSLSCPKQVLHVTSYRTWVIIG
jgi:hypothetical protein